MKERINEKMKEIQEFLDFIVERIPETLEEYKKDLDKKAICERYIEKIIEAIVDLAFLIVKYLNIQIPAETSDKEIFSLLSDNKIISKELSAKMQDAKGMRNIIAHEYGKINDEIIFESISSELIDDTKDFISAIEKALEEIKWTSIS